MKIRIGTRKSPLALFQAEKVSKILTANNFENINFAIYVANFGWS